MKELGTQPQPPPVVGHLATGVGQDEREGEGRGAETGLGVRWPAKQFGSSVGFGWLEWLVHELRRRTVLDILEGVSPVQPFQAGASKESFP